MVFLLALYIVFLIGFAVYSIIGIYHLWRFGYIGDLTKPAIAIYIVVTAVIIVLSLVLISTRSWPVDFNL